MADMLTSNCLAQKAKARAVGRLQHRQPVLRRQKYFDALSTAV